jgi:hypothetical protein
MMLRRESVVRFSRLSGRFGISCIRADWLSIRARKELRSSENCTTKAGTREERVLTERSLIDIIGRATFNLSRGSWPAMRSVSFWT